MNLENMFTKERTHKKSQIVLFHLYEMSRIDKCIEKESRLVVARSYAKRQWVQNLHNRSRIPFKGMKMLIVSTGV
jgi:hypothetical protein